MAKQKLPHPQCLVMKRYMPTRQKIVGIIGVQYARASPELHGRLRCARLPRCTSVIECQHQPCEHDGNEIR